MTENSPQPEKIKNMFACLAKNYDKANAVLSVGIHHRWRQQLVHWSGVDKGDKVLDCATGTGDLAIAFKKTVAAEGVVVASDFCQEMLHWGIVKSQKMGLDIHWEQSDVTKLPYSDNEFDVAAISFGIRNVQDPGKGIAEMARVVKPSGVVMVLEFGQVTLPGFKRLFDFYARHVLPMIGGFLTGDKAAYVYLQKSAAGFPSRHEFIALMQKAYAFQKIEYRTLTGGIAYIYKATK
jgi:demethylmenaquinone methyltransferase/2-methoxy-6-polyprenyl-1,4-benzoquinol methylase